MLLTRRETLEALGGLFAGYAKEKLADAQQFADWLTTLGPEAETIHSPPIEHHRQQHSLSCEAASTAMILKAILGRVKSLSGDWITDATAIENDIQERLGHDPDPHKAFRGIVDNGISLIDYGTYAEAVLRVTRLLGAEGWINYHKEENLVEADAWDRGNPFRDQKKEKNLLERYQQDLDWLDKQVKDNHGVVVWGEYASDNPEIEYEANSDGTTYKLVLGEHAIVVGGRREVNVRVQKNGESWIYQQRQFLIHDPLADGDYWVNDDWLVNSFHIDLFDGMMLSLWRAPNYRQPRGEEN